MQHGKAPDPDKGGELSDVRILIIKDAQAGAIYNLAIDDEQWESLKAEGDKRAKIDIATSLPGKLGGT